MNVLTSRCDTGCMRDGISAAASSVAVMASAVAVGDIAAWTCSVFSMRAMMSLTCSSGVGGNRATTSSSRVIVRRGGAPSAHAFERAWSAQSFESGVCCAVLRNTIPFAFIVGRQCRIAADKACTMLLRCMMACVHRLSSTWTSAVLGGTMTQM